MFPNHKAGVLQGRSGYPEEALRLFSRPPSKTIFMIAPDIISPFHVHSHVIVGGVFLRLCDLG